MTQPIDIKGIKLGEGRPKTIISLMGAKADENIELIKKGIEADVECFEWRGDFAADVHDPQAMAQQSIEIGKALSNNPYLFTFRSTSQGGHLTIPVEEYVALNKAIIEAEAVDLVDIETWIGDPAVLE